MLYSWFIWISRQSPDRDNDLLKAAQLICKWNKDSNLDSQLGMGSFPNFIEDKLYHWDQIQLIRQQACCDQIHWVNLLGWLRTLGCNDKVKKWYSSRLWWSRSTQLLALSQIGILPLKQNEKLTYKQANKVTCWASELRLSQQFPRVSTREESS